MRRGECRVQELPLFAMNVTTSSCKSCSKEQLIPTGFKRKIVIGRSTSLNEGMDVHEEFGCFFECISLFHEHGVQCSRIGDVEDFRL